MISWIVIVLCTMAAVELGVRLPFQARLIDVRETAALVATTIAAAGVSDRRKERILTACARRTLVNSVALFLLLLAVLSPFLLAVPLSAFADHGILAPAMSSGGIAASMVSAAVYAFLRARVARHL